MVRPQIDGQYDLALSIKRESSGRASAGSRGFFGFTNQADVSQHAEALRHGRAGLAGESGEIAPGSGFAVAQDLEDLSRTPWPVSFRSCDVVHIRVRSFSIVHEVHY